MVKPDGVQRGLVGDIIKRFEQRGFKLVAMKFMQGSKEHLKQHYIDLKVGCGGGMAHAAWVVGRRNI